MIGVQPKIDFAIGGQALIEGVMMRSPNFVSIAVRKPDGSIAMKQDPFQSLSKKIKIFKLPFLRGILNLFEMLIIGMRSMNFSVQVSIEDETETDEKEKTGVKKFFEGLSFVISIIAALAFALFLFKFLPLFITSQLEKIYPALKKHYLYFNIVDGVIRISIFFLYIALLSIFKSFRRVFEYHGAEHKAVFTYEKGHALTIENVKKESPRHPRCGTSFIIIVFVIAIFLFTLLPRHPNFWANLGLRLFIIPIIASIGYEILKWSAKHQHRWFFRFISAPGILTQKITTKEPDEKQIEIAIEALNGALELEKNR